MILEEVMLRRLARRPLLKNRIRLEQRARKAVIRGLTEASQGLLTTEY